jgi:hypothetical protein
MWRKILKNSFYRARKPAVMALVIIVIFIYVEVTTSLGFVAL